MLVSRHSETDLSPWSVNKFETSPFPRKSAASPRMSNSEYATPLSTGTDWQGQYSFLPPGEHNIFSQTYDHVGGSSDTTPSQAQPRSTAADAGLDIDVKAESHSPLGHRIDPLGLHTTKRPSPIPEQPEPSGEAFAQKAADSVQEESLVADAPGLGHGLSSAPTVGQVPEISASQPGNEGQAEPKEDEDEVLDDEDMMDGDGDAPSQPQTAAERTAQRRKMKRFR